MKKLLKVISLCLVLTTVLSVCAFGAKSYTLTYVSDGCTNLPKAQSGSTEYVISDIIPERFPDSFAYWTDVNGSKYYYPGDVIKLRKDTELYPVWEPTPILFLFDYEKLEFSKLWQKHIMRIVPDLTDCFCIEVDGYAAGGMVLCDKNGKELCKGIYGVFGNLEIRYRLQEGKEYFVVVSSRVDYSDNAYETCTIHYEIGHLPTPGVIKRATMFNDGIYGMCCAECGKKMYSIDTINKVSTVKISTGAYTYDGKVKTPLVTVKDSKGNALKKNRDYKVKYSAGRKNVGTYSVLVTLCGDYLGQKTFTFKIIPKGTTISKLMAKSKAFTANIAKQTTQTTGYQMQYATNKKFSSAKLIAMKNTTMSKSVTGLKAKTNYYVRVRTYKTVGKVNYYSKWSSVKSIKTK